MTRRLWVIECRLHWEPRFYIWDTVHENYRARRTALRKCRENNAHAEFRLMPYVPAGPKSRKRVRQ